MMTGPARMMGVATLLVALAACSQTKEEKVQPQPAPPPMEKPAAQQARPKAPAAPKPAPVLRPAAPAKPFVPKAPGVRVSSVAVDGPYVALTFDDGPHASYTPQILDILKRHGAHATFFVLGSNATRHPGILARAVAEGNEIGSHTWNHMNMSRSSHEAICSDMDRTSEAIEKATGRKPRVMRPPYGAANSGVISLVHGRYGTPAIFWDVDTKDWQHPGVGTVIDRAVSKAKPGSIILVHDIHASTLAAVEGIVNGLQARGFKLVTVSQLMALGRRAANRAAAPAAAPAPAPAPAADAAPEAQPLELPAAPQPEEGAGATSIGTAPTEPAPAQPVPAAESAQGSTSISAGEPEL